MLHYAVVRNNPTPVAPLLANEYELEVRQEPREALVTLEGKEKLRKPVDPPPIVQVRVHHASDPRQQFLQSPYLFMCVSLWVPPKAEMQPTNVRHSLAGSLVSSLHRLKDTDNSDGGFFVFGDVSIKVPGEHRLSFSLFELRKGINPERDTGEVIYLKSIISRPFRVLQPKDFRGLDESTYLSRAFSDQGVRLRLRKEPRGLLGAKRHFMYNGPPPTSQPQESQQSAETTVPSTPVSQQQYSNDGHTYSEETSPAVVSSVKRVRQSAEYGTIQQDEVTSPTYYEQHSPITSGDNGDSDYHSRKHSFYPSNTHNPLPVRPPSFNETYPSISSPIVPPPLSSSHSQPTRRLPLSIPLTLRQAQHQEPQPYQYQEQLHQQQQQQRQQNDGHYYDQQQHHQSDGHYYEQQQQQQHSDGYYYEQQQQAIYCTSALPMQNPVIEQQTTTDAPPTSNYMIDSLAAGAGAATSHVSSERYENFTTTTSANDPNSATTTASPLFDPTAYSNTSQADYEAELGAAAAVTSAPYSMGLPATSLPPLSLPPTTSIAEQRYVIGDLSAVPGDVMSGTMGY